jgi:hypothetical protein
MSASFLARSSASVTDTLAWRAVLSENWLQVERLVSCPHFEANADHSVGVEDQPAGAQYTGAQIDRRAVENDDLHGTLQTPLKVGFQIEWPGVEGGRRRAPVQDPKIDVAVRTGPVPRDAAKQIHGADAVISRVEKVVHTLLDLGSSHDIDYSAAIPTLGSVSTGSIGREATRGVEEFRANQGDRGGDRTRGPRIKSALLYH